MERSLLIMALSINDVIALANAGFTKTDIAAFMNLGNPQTTPPSPVQVPGATAPTVPTVPATVPAPAPAQQAPATPDLGQLVASLADLNKKVDALNVPTAGTVGALPTVTSVEDIILGAVKPAPAPESPQLFNMEGVVKNG
jgi:hypothetical protein